MKLAAWLRPVAFGGTVRTVRCGSSAPLGLELEPKTELHYSIMRYEWIRLTR